MKRIRSSCPRRHLSLGTRSSLANGGNLVLGPGGQVSIISGSGLNPEQVSQPEPGTESSQITPPTTLLPATSIDTKPTISVFSSISSFSASTTVASFSQLATSSSSPSVSSSLPTEAINRNPPFYIGIVLGTIVVIACIAALLAWCIRLRLHRRSRCDFTAPDLSWEQRSDHVLESTRSPFFIKGEPLSATYEKWGTRPPDASCHPSVGVPKSFNDDSLKQFPALKIPATSYFSNAQLPFYPEPTNSAQCNVRSGNITYPVGTSHLASRLFLSHPENDSSSVPDGSNAVGPPQVIGATPEHYASSRPGTSLSTPPLGGWSEVGTPWESVPGSRPRFFGLDGTGLAVPWSRSHETSSTTASRESDIRSFASTPHRKSSLLPLPTSKKQIWTSASDLGNSGWTASLRSNIVSAFNVVANNLSLRSTVDKDISTSLPHGIAQRLSIHDKGRGDCVGKKLVTKTLTGGLTTHSYSSRSSNMWTLEETGDGIGVVHIHGLDDYKAGGRAWSTEVTSGRWIERDNESKRKAPTPTLQSHTPLARRPSAVYSRYFSVDRMCSGSVDGVSRASSRYSAATATSSTSGDGGSDLKS